MSSNSAHRANRTLVVHESEMERLFVLLGNIEKHTSRETMEKCCVSSPDLLACSHGLAVEALAMIEIIRDRNISSIPCID